MRTHSRVSGRDFILYVEGALDGPHLSDRSPLRSWMRLVLKYDPRIFDHALIVLVYTCLCDDSDYVWSFFKSTSQCAFPICSTILNLNASCIDYAQTFWHSTPCPSRLGHCGRDALARSLQCTFKRATNIDFFFDVEPPVGREVATPSALLLSNVLKSRIVEKYWGIFPSHHHDLTTFAILIVMASWTLLARSATRALNKPWSWFELATGFMGHEGMKVADLLWLSRFVLGLVSICHLISSTQLGWSRNENVIEILTSSILWLAMQSGTYAVAILACAEFVLKKYVFQCKCLTNWRTESWWFEV